MNQSMNQTTQLTVAKICHEMANHLSILKFIQEDLADFDRPEIKEMLKTIDLLSITMDFFRNIYSPKIDPVAVSKDLQQIYDLKEIEISDPDGVLQSVPENLQSAIDAILYTIMKNSKPGDIVKVSKSDNGIILEIPTGRALPQNILNAFVKTPVADDIFNIFVNYAKHLASLDGFKILNEEDQIIFAEKR